MARSWPTTPLFEVEADPGAALEAWVPLDDAALDCFLENPVTVS
jgi:hypothetical protein